MQPELEEALLGLDELAQHNAEEALNVFQTLPAPVQDLPDFQLVLARANQALGRLEEARTLSMRVVDNHESSADAHHLLADLLEDLGDTTLANHHFLRTLELDRLQFERESEIPKEELFARLEKVLSDACDPLPKDVSLKSRVELLPSVEEVEGGLDPRALTSYLPPGRGGEEALLTLFAANLDAEFGDLEEFGEFAPHVQRAIRDDLIGHLSLTPGQLRQIGWEIPESNEFND